MWLDSFSRWLLHRARLRWLALAGLGWLIVSIIFWWLFVYSTPQRAFHDMLVLNFMTPGYTRTVQAKQGDTEQLRVAQVQLTNRPTVHATETVRQKEQTQTTEFISTPKKDFARFLEYQTADIENQWAIMPASTTFASEVVERTYFPMGPLPQAEREELVRFIKENAVYNVDYNTVKKETVNGHSVYTYQVTVQLQAYAAMLKQFGSAIGLSAQVEKIDPSSFAGSKPIALRVSIDRVSHRLIEWGNAATTDVSERYSGYGITDKEVRTPKQYITLAELEKRLQ